MGDYGKRREPPKPEAKEPREVGRLRRIPVSEQELIAIRAIAAVFVQTETAETREGAHKKALVRATWAYLGMRELTTKKTKDNLYPDGSTVSMVFAPQVTGGTAILIRGPKGPEED